MFFETSESFSVGEPISFKVEFNGPGGRMLLTCLGEIIRTENRNDRIGVGVRIEMAAMGLVEH